ncbi:MAG: hypothetical protein V1494_04710 [Candidatus Diapherotrites archaeon]
MAGDVLGALDEANDLLLSAEKTVRTVERAEGTAKKVSGMAGKGWLYILIAAAVLLILAALFVLTGSF